MLILKLKFSIRLPVDSGTPIGGADNPRPHVLDGPPHGSSTNALPDMKWVWQRTLLSDECLYTVQTITLSTCTYLVWFVGEASLFTSMPQYGALTVAYTLAPVVSTMLVILTPLFLMLCWWEPKWRRTVLAPMERAKPGFGAVMLYEHCVELPLGLGALLAVMERPLLIAVMPSARMLTWIGAGYSCLYVGLLYVMYSRFNVAVYPFVADLHAVRPWPVGWLGFGGGISGLNVLALNLVAWLVGGP